MCDFVYACVYVHGVWFMHACVCLCDCMHACVGMHMCDCVCICICAWCVCVVCMSVCACARMILCVYACVYVCGMCVHVHMCAHTDILISGWEEGCLSSTSSPLYSRGRHAWQCVEKPRGTGAHVDFALSAPLSSGRGD